MALFTTSPLPTLGSSEPPRRRASVGATPGCTTCQRASVGEIPSLPIALLIGGTIIVLLAVL